MSRAARVADAAPRRLRHDAATRCLASPRRLRACRAAPRRRPRARRAAPRRRPRASPPPPSPRLPERTRSTPSAARSARRARCVGRAAARRTTSPTTPFCSCACESTRCGARPQRALRVARRAQCASPCPSRVARAAVERPSRSRVARAQTVREGRSESYTARRLLRRPPDPHRTASTSLSPRQVSRRGRRTAPPVLVLGAAAGAAVGAAATAAVGAAATAAAGAAVGAARSAAAAVAGRRTGGGGRRCGGGVPSFGAALRAAIELGPESGTPCPSLALAADPRAAAPPRGDAAAAAAAAAHSPRRCRCRSVRRSASAPASSPAAARGGGGGGCAARARLRRRLLGPPPPVFALNLLWPTELPKRARGCRCSGGVARRNGGGAGGGAGKHTTPRSVSERTAPSTRASPTRRASPKRAVGNNSLRLIALFTSLPIWKCVSPPLQSGTCRSLLFPSLVVIVN